MVNIRKSPGKHLRRIVWMLIGFPLLLLTYLALLTTNLFDSRPKEYPELALPPQPPGAKTFGEVYGEILARNPQWTPDRDRAVYDDARLHLSQSFSQEAPFDQTKIQAFVEEAEKSIGILRELSAYSGLWAMEDPEELAKDLTALVEMRFLIDELFLLTMAGDRHGISAPGLPDATKLALQTCVTVKPALSDSIGGLVLGSANQKAFQLAGWTMRMPRPAEEQKALLKDWQELIAPSEIDQKVIDAIIRTDFAVGVAKNAEMHPRSLLWVDETDLKAFASAMGGGQTSTKLRWQALRTQPNRCIELWVRMYPHLLAQSALPHNQRKPWPLPTRPPIWSLSPNAGGMLFLLEFTGLENLTNLDHSRAHARLMVVLSAIARHRLDHAGTLPAKLDDLVPKYLDHVPKDPFTGDPVSYDPASARIWCTGDDGKTDATPVEHPEVDTSLVPPGLEGIFAGQGPADRVIDLGKFFAE